MILNITNLTKAHNPKFDFLIIKSYYRHLFFHVNSAFLYFKCFEHIFLKPRIALEALKDV